MSEDYEENNIDEAQEESIVVATEIFENSWKKIKQEVEGVSKKEACKYSFILGFLNYMGIMDKKAEVIEKEMKNMSHEDLHKIIDQLKEEDNKNE